MNRKLLQQLKPEQIEVEIVRVEELEETGVKEAELDEMWSYVSSKKNPRWLWHGMPIPASDLWGESPLVPIVCTGT